MGKNIFSKSYKYLPCERQSEESVVSLLYMRETGVTRTCHVKSSKTKQSSSYRKSQVFYSRSLSAAKFGSSAFPQLLPISYICHINKNGGNSLRSRQFEYHPSNSNLMAFGTLEGEVIVINHENGNVLYNIPSFKESSSVMGLCWFSKHPSKLLAGFDDGSLRLYDINQVQPKVENNYHRPSYINFDDFEQLTSIHINSTEDLFLTTSYSKKVAMYDVCSGKRVNVFNHMHKEPINVAKFAHHSPNLFVTSSFDHDVKMWDLRQRATYPCYTASSSSGNVMVCFSPDDMYLLVSAVDNKVKQLLAADGRLSVDFDIASTGNYHNYTRSYYMNGRDYIISGSCEEPVVRICCAQTGRQLRNVCMEERSSRSLTFVQSLRSDPFRQFHMAVLMACAPPSSKREIIKVNLLASREQDEENSQCQNSFPLCGWEA